MPKYSAEGQAEDITPPGPVRGTRFDAPRNSAYAQGSHAEEAAMAKLALVYGMRLFPAEELGEVSEATLLLKDGRTARVTMHLIEGSKEEIEATLQQSIEAFFEMYPEI